jgi:signal transduction histidine kinase
MAIHKTIELSLRYWLSEKKGYHIIAVIACLFFACVTITGIQAQMHFSKPLLHPLLHGNIAIIVVSTFFLTTMTQYFWLKNKAFWYYSLYLLCNIIYFHYAVFLGGAQIKALQLEQLRLFPCIIHFIFGYSLMSSFVLYTFFVIHFLRIPENYPDFYQRLKIYSKLYLILIGLYTCVVLFVHDEPLWLNCFQILLGCCIPIGAYTLFDCFKTLKGRLSNIFLTGSACYFILSSIGFLYETAFFYNLLKNNYIQNSVFFIQIGVILEVICFSAGLSYQMQLVGIEKQQMEAALFLQKVQALEFEKAWLKEQQIRLAERKRIMADLHDEVQGTLAGISIFAGIAQMQLQAKEPKIATIIENIGEKARQMIDTIKQIVRSTSNENERFENIICQMQQYANDLSANKTINIDFQLDSNLNALNLGLERNKEFYLIFKEGVFNVFKYANAAQLKIRLEKNEPNMILTIADNGQGFDINGVKAGAGLLNMKKRAKILGGQLQIKSQLGAGTTLILCFPLHAKDKTTQNG